MFGATRWDPDGPGPEREWLVLAGEHVLPFNGFARSIVGWDGDRFRDFGDLTALGGAVIEHVTTWNGLLVATTRSASIPKVFVLRDGVWTLVGTNLTSGSIRRVLEYRGELLIAGNALQSTTGRSAVMVFRDGVWQPLGPSINGIGADLIEYEGELVVAGSFSTQAPGVNVAAWNGTTWRPLGAGLSGREVRGLAVFDGRLIAVGDITGSGARTLRSAASWNGSDWVSLAFNSTAALYQVAAFDDALVVAGPSSLWRWDRTQWTTLPPTGSSLNLSTNANTSLVPFGGDLAICPATPVGGPYASSRSLRIARLVDWNLRSFARGPRVSNLRAISQGAVYLGKVFAAGPFLDIAGLTANGVGVWDGVTWESIGTGLVGASWPNGLRSFSGGVVVIGSITGVIDPVTGATVPTKGVARWDGERWRAFDQGLPGVPTSLGLDGDAPVVAVDVVPSNPARFKVMRYESEQWSSIGELPGLAREAAIDAGSGMLVVAGARRNEAGLQTNNYVAAWNGQEWRYLLDDPGTWTNRYVGFHAGDLYLMGDFNTLGGVSIASLARWDGTGWRAMGDGPGFRATSLLSTSDGHMIVGGYSSSGARVSRWDGQRWTAIDIGPVAANSYVLKLIEHHGELVALGTFPDTTLGSESVAVRRVNIGGDAWIARQPKGAEIACGGATVLRARVANGYSVVAATWYRGDEPVVHDPVRGVRVELDGAQATLRLNNVSGAHAGNYRCVFETPCGAITTDLAMVTVTGVCCPGDLTLDGVIDDRDFSLFAVDYASMRCDSAKVLPGCAADLNGDSLIDNLDFERFARAYDGFLCGE